ncbi:MAG: hypothetical protein IMY67_05670 [Bacteroidetes bacterium]|nr:hypothetical protein [Bacteroidota bacterium]
MEKIGFIIFLLLFQNNFAQVGIGTTDPQQKLHIASPTGTLRVESLDKNFNVYNGGDINNDGDFTNDLYPLYVDGYGDFTLFFKPLLNSEDLDAFNDSELPNSSVSLFSNDDDGIATTIITTYTITVRRESVLELKYNMSYEVYLEDSSPNPIILSDRLARRIETYITADDVADPVGNPFEDLRKYGPASKCYSSGSLNSAPGTFYNSCTTYITLRSDTNTYPATFTIRFNGAVSSDIKPNTASGNTSENTFVKFATGDDFVFARLH